MKVSKMTIEYQVTRSRDYQSVRMGGSVEVELEEGEDLKERFDKARKWLSAQVNAAAEDELEIIVFGGKK
jgi:hypothetical protein